MYLKSLVLKGFKSFADRSALFMEPGITAIVGPNGSGKSNISDAVLWVLGERNAKHLRGQAMEDVIFAGSSARKPVGIAEVDLILDNSDGTLPVDYSEVAITRRMYRSGESEYLINGTVARRMDVLDILHDSGLGTGTHSIISQGSLDSILQSKPEDRRALIEEAAGVLKHKQRKAKSERKLEHMDQHLARVRDVVGEVQRQLGPLERKAKRALAYQGLADELSDLNLRLAVDDLRVLQRKWDEVVERERLLADEIEEKRAAIEQAETQAEGLQKKIQLDSADMTELSQRYRHASAAVDKFDSVILVMHERRRAAIARTSELKLTIEANKVKQRSAQEECTQIEAQLDTVKTQRAQADARVEELTVLQRSLAAQCMQVEQEATDLDRLSRDIESKIDDARRQQSQAQEALSNGLAHIKLIEGHKKELALQLARAQTDAESLAHTAAQSAERLAGLSEREAHVRTCAGEALRASEQARTALSGARDEERALASEIKGLEEIERVNAAASGPARAWLLEHGSSFAAEIAPLAQVIVAPPGKEALVERLLGADVAAVLVGDSHAAREVSRALLDSKEKGEVALIMRQDTFGGAASALAYSNASSGAVLIEELSYPSEAARVVSALLGDVILCESLSHAFLAHEQDTVGLRFVSPDGCIVWPSGKVTVGSALVEGEEGVLMRARRLADVRLRHTEAEQACQKAVLALEQAETDQRAAQAESLACTQELAQQRGQAEAARAEADRAAEKLTALRRELEEVERQRQEADTIVGAARPDVEKLAEDLKVLVAALDETKEKIATTQDTVAPLRSETRRIAEELAEAKLQAAKLVERETYTLRVRDARVREKEHLAKADVQDQATLLKQTISAQRLEPLLVLFEDLVASARTWTRELEDKATAAQNASTGLHTAVNEARASARRAHDAFDEASERLGSVRVDKGRLEVQVEAAVNVIVHDCKTPLETALTLPELDERLELENAVFKLRRRIANMGTINPDAADEYEDLKKRYDYLEHQLTDLDSARRTLAKINRVIDARMKEDFIRTYEAVDTNFQEIFAILFPGGSAHLSLVDPDDLENTGVEVTAQPRGKRITKMMLMSGGEKSLTALALLFAVYRIRTTPFYILDEVEAALDDTNLRRLVTYINSLRDHTQLIMITHQRRTMEMADVLFGVSMQADGVTKVISQKLDKALQHAE